MSNLIQYTETMQASWEEKPFSAVDSLVFSCLAYCRFSETLPEVTSWKGIPLARLFCAEFFPSLFRDIKDPTTQKALLTAVIANPRYRQVRIAGYREALDKETQKQFGAMTFRLGNGESYLAFRGTNPTLVGWKEDFNMSFQYPVPSQLEALHYLQEAARHLRGSLYVGGHSKGGNLAIFASANCSPALQKRILKVFSHDGPGFPEEKACQKCFQRIYPKVDKTVPQSSIVGMILSDLGDYRVVQSTRASIWQHNPFSWVIEKDDFVYDTSVNLQSKTMDRALNGWIRDVDREQRERFIDTLYDLIDTSDCTTFPELMENWKTNLPAIMKATSALAPDTKTFLKETVKVFGSAVVDNFKKLVKEGLSQEKSTAGAGGVKSLPQPEEQAEK